MCRKRIGIGLATVGLDRPKVDNLESIFMRKFNEFLVSTSMQRERDREGEAHMWLQEVANKSVLPGEKWNKNQTKHCRMMQHETGPERGKAEAENQFSKRTKNNKDRRSVKSWLNDTLYLSKFSINIILLKGKKYSKKHSISLWNKY